MHARALLATMALLCMLTVGCTGANPVDTAGSEAEDRVATSAGSTPAEGGAAGPGATEPDLGSTSPAAPDAGTDAAPDGGDGVAPGEGDPPGFGEGRERPTGDPEPSQTPAVDLQSLDAIRDERITVPAGQTVSRTLQVVAGVLYRIEATPEGDADAVITIISPDGSEEVVDNNFGPEAENRLFQTDGEARFVVSEFDGEGVTLTLTVAPGE